MARTVKNIIYLRTSDGNYTANVNCYNGKTYLTIFQKDSSIPLSIWISDTIQYFIKKYLKQVIKDNKPGSQNTIVISNFNQDTKTFDKSAVLTIGVDDKGFIYLGVNILISSNKKSNDEIANKDIIFTFELPKAIEISSESLDDIQKNKKAADIALDIFQNKLTILETATLEVDLNTLNDMKNTTEVNTQTDEVLF